MTTMNSPSAPQKPKLLDRVRRAIRSRHYSRNTEDAYVAWIKRFISRDEVQAILAHLRGTSRLMGTFLYGAGLRVLECCRLRVKDLDFAASKQIVVRNGKGDKDRVTLLPGVAASDLARHLEAVHVQHQRDLGRGAGWVELPGALGRKYPNAGREWGVAMGLPGDPFLP